MKIHCSLWSAFFPYKQVQIQCYQWSQILSYLLASSRARFDKSCLSPVHPDPMVPAKAVPGIPVRAISLLLVKALPYLLLQAVPYPPVMVDRYLPAQAVQLLHQENVNRPGSKVQTSQTLWSTAPVLLSTSGCSQAPPGAKPRGLRLCKSIDRYSWRILQLWRYIQDAPMFDL